MDLYERIIELSSMGYHCSQMVMIMTLEAIGEENPQLVKALGGLGGGIGYCGDTCGCLTGGACAIGLFLGNLAPQEKEDIQMKPAVQELYQWFHKKTEEEFGAFYCKDITSNLDWGVIMELGRNGSRVSFLGKRKPVCGDSGKSQNQREILPG